MQKKSNFSSTIASALVEILNRLSPDEKKQFARVFNWDEFGRIKKEINGSDGRRHGDPKVYVEASSGELNFEIPENKLTNFVGLLSEILSYDQINVFVRKGETSEEHSYSKEEFRNFLVFAMILPFFLLKEMSRFVQELQQRVNNG